MNKGAIIAASLALSAGWMLPAAHAAVIFSENFNDGSVDAAITGSNTLAVDTAPSGEQFLGRDTPPNNVEPGNRGLGSLDGVTFDTVSLSLSGLAAHTSATLNFSLYVLNSMDGTEPFSVSETIAGILLGATCPNAFGVAQCNVTAPTPGIQLPDAVNTLGFTKLNSNTTTSDSIYNFSLTFAHSASALDLAFSYSGLQDIPDESWGLDNISVAIDADGVTPPSSGVPEPGSLALLGSALAGFWITRRRTRRA